MPPRQKISIQLVGYASIHSHDFGSTPLLVEGILSFFLWTISLLKAHEDLLLLMRDM